MDWGIIHKYADWAALITGVIALAGVFIVRKSSIRNRTTEERIDADVLSKFETLWLKISELEKVVAEQGFELKSAMNEIREMKKVEEYLQGKIHEREKQIKTLNAQLDSARRRIRHLELVCKRAGINGEDLDNPSDV